MASCCFLDLLTSRNEEKNGNVSESKVLSAALGRAAIQFAQWTRPSALAMKFLLKCSSTIMPTGTLMGLCFGMVIF
jgi:hypothetical protein